MALRTVRLRRPTTRSSLGFVEAELLDEDGDVGWELLPGAMLNVLLAGVPLDHWERLATSDVVEALDPAGVSYRVVEWHPGEVEPSPTGRDLHFVYATLLCLGPSHNKAVRTSSGQED